MEKREIILRRVALKCHDFARQLSYHRALDRFKNEFKLNYLITMFNNTIDLAVLDWFHLFGYHDDDLHWKKIVDDINNFRTGLFDCLKVTEDEWQSYRETVKDYRDKDIAHIEVRPVSDVPEMDIALNAANYYYKQVLRELSKYRGYKWPIDLSDYYQKSYEQTKIIASVVYESTRSIEEEVL